MVPDHNSSPATATMFLSLIPPLTAKRGVQRPQVPPGQARVDCVPAPGLWLLPRPGRPARRRRVFLVQADDGRRLQAGQEAGVRQGPALQGHRGTQRGPGELSLTVMALLPPLRAVTIMMTVTMTMTVRMGMIMPMMLTMTSTLTSPRTLALTTVYLRSARPQWWFTV